MPRNQSPAPKEPTALRGAIAFEEGDFFALSPAMSGNPDANARRLGTRRKLLALGKEVAKEAGLECRSSLHNPHAFNGMRVSRLWTYLVRSKADKRKLKGVLGAELGKDLDAAYRNAYLCMAIEADALEVSLRIHSDAWYDGQNLKNKVGSEVRAWLGELNRLEGFRLRMDDWKGEWVCGDLTPERLEEFLSYYTPGEHRLTVDQRWPAPPGARDHAFGEEPPQRMKAELERLFELYRFIAWSPENNFLFGG